LARGEWQTDGIGSPIRCSVRSSAMQLDEPSAHVCWSENGGRRPQARLLRRWRSASRCHF